MFDKMRKHFGKNVQAAPPESFDQKVDPMKKMLTDYANLIGNEISKNNKLDDKQDFELIVKNLGKGSGNAIPGKDLMQLRAIKKEDLSKILKKIDEWNKDESSSELPLLPREIEAMQQIISAIEKKELVIRQGDNLFAVHNSQVYNAIIDQHATIEKVENLAKQKFVGRSKGGLGIGDKSEDVEGIYDLLDKNVDLGEAFGGFDEDGQRKAIFSESEFKQVSEEISDEEQGRMRRVSYTEDFKQESETVSSKHNEKSISKSEIESKETKKEVKGSGKAQGKGTAETVGKDQAEQNKKDYLRSQTHDTARKVRETIRLNERQFDREARRKKDQIRKLTKKLDKKRDLISEKQDDFDLKQEIIDDHQDTA